MTKKLFVLTACNALTLISLVGGSVLPLEIVTKPLTDFDQGPFLKVIVPKDAELHVLAPKESDETTLISLDEGYPLNLTCFIDNDNEYNVNWYLSDSVQPKLSKSRQKNSLSILMETVRPRNDGPITCTAKAIDGGRVHDESFRRHIVLKIRPRETSGMCGLNFFQCPKSHCIHRRFVCDGVKDCKDGYDESEEHCGEDACKAKLRCRQGRCLDPALCCDPDVDPKCKVVPECCEALIESNRRFFRLGIEARNKEELRFLHSTIYIVVACVLAFVALIAIMTMLVCRIHVRRNILGFNGRSRRYRQRCGHFAPLSLQDLELYFHPLHRRTSRDNNSSDGAGITYNINNGVQFVGVAPPPPYNEVGNGNQNGGNDQVANNNQENDQNNQMHADPPPPYEINENDESEPNLNAQDDNNNGDINGNSEMVNQNIVVAQAAAAAAAAADDDDDEVENENGQSDEANQLLQQS